MGLSKLVTFSLNHVLLSAIICQISTICVQFYNSISLWKDPKYYFHSSNNFRI